MVSFFAQQRSVFLLALVALTGLVVVPPGGLHVAATTDSAAEGTMEPTTGAPQDDDEPRDSFLDCPPELLGDGQCDDDYNNETCGYDNGDCCECTCEPDAFNCGGNYDCIDPDAECVDDDDGDGGVLTTADLDDDPVAVEDADSSAAGISPSSSVSTGVAAAVGAAALLAGFAL